MPASRGSLVTRGAGTGLSCGANAIDGCALLGTERIATIKEIDPVERLAVVEPGVIDDDTRIANIAHAGDGNLHPLLITPPGDDAARVRAQAAFERIIGDALDLGGTVTGEHGVGTLKRNGLRRELSPEALDMHRAIKAALDPSDIFNPGKIVRAHP